MKTVLITGVLGGMGKATAELLLKQNYKVIGFDVSESCDMPISYYQVDLTNLDQINNVYNQLVKNIERIDAIIHFAGIYKMDSLVEISEKDMLKIFEVNFFSMYRVNKTFLPLLTKGGRIVITSSELAPLNPLPFTGVYAITKSTIEKYAYSLRMELQLLDIKVCVVRPGAVKTTLLNCSISEMDKLCEKTTLYLDNTNKFRKIVNSVENKNINPIKIAKKVNKILDKKKPKFVYNVNRNFLLRLFSFLPKRIQFFLIKKLLKSKKQK